MLLVKEKFENISLAYRPPLHGCAERIEIKDKNKIDKVRFFIEFKIKESK
jgi:hypothetical protein